jgi:polyisoprenoid-binding protein YceI
MKRIYTVDPNHTTVGFSAKHMLVTTIRGRFTRWSGQVEVADDDLTSARVTGSIEAASVESGLDYRDNDLRDHILDSSTTPRSATKARRSSRAERAAIG